MGKIKKAVDGLTNGNRRDDRVNIFNYVRDIQYFGSHNDNPVDAMKENKANCGQKARLLKMMLEKLGEEVKTISARYKIEDLPLPKEITDVWPMDHDYHLAVLIRIEGEWKLLDPTADKGLKWGGFVVNKWDGESNTKWYVEPEKVSYEGKKNKEEFGEELDEWLGELERNKGDIEEFVKRENEYLENIRKSKIKKIKNYIKSKI